LPDESQGRFSVVTTAERPDLHDEAGAAFREKWPEFVFHDAVAKRYMPRVEEAFPDYDVLVLDDGAVAAGGWGVPLRWDGTLEDLPDGYDPTLVRSIEDLEAGRLPNTLSFMAAAVGRRHDRRGLAVLVLEALTDRARRAGIEQVIAPLRPTWKHRYPLVSMADYATWTRDDGLSIDPWIRTHQRMGARVLGPASRSMVIEGRVQEWEDWAQMPFPVSGDYVVPGALGLVHVDRDRDAASYIEENLWVRHR
jgi:GNAT superfamily N-acetyltransferase